MNDLEDFAKRSADSARASVAHLTVPPTPGRSVPKPVLRLGTIAAVIAGLVIVFLILPRGGPTPTDVAAAPTTELAGSSTTRSTTYFELDVPDGWTLSASDGSNDTSVNATFAYGTGTANDPFSAADLMISEIQVDVGFNLGEAFRGDFMVRGHSAMPDDSAEGLVRVSWQERDDLVIGLSSRHYGLEDMVAIADGLNVDGFEVTLPAPPDGMKLVSSMGITALGDAGPSAMWNLDLTNASSESGLVQDGFVEVQLQAMPEGKGALPYLRYLMAESGTDVTVRGTPGVMTQTLFDSSGGRLVRTVAWIEDGELFILSVSGPDDPLAIVNSLRKIDRTRFEELLAAHSPSLTTTPPLAFNPTTSDPEGPPGPAVTIAAP